MVVCWQSECVDIEAMFKVLLVISYHCVYLWPLAICNNNGLSNVLKRQHHVTPSQRRNRCSQIAVNRNICYRLGVIPRCLSKSTGFTSCWLLEPASSSEGVLRRISAAKLRIWCKSVEG